MSLMQDRLCTQQYNMINLNIENGSVKTVLFTIAICKMWTLIRPIQRVKKLFFSKNE